jgi:hypothetical protein
MTTGTEDLSYPIGRFSAQAPSAERRRRAVADIGALPGHLSTAILGLSDAQLDTPYRDGGWTTRQIVHHLADSHMNAFIRFRLALTEDRPTIKPYNENEWSKLPDAQLDPQVSVQILDGLHQRWHSMLLAMRESDFTREAIHPDHGPRTIDWFLQLYAWHGRHHIGHIKLTH